MTRDDIIRMAQEACKPDAPFRQYVGGVDCGMLMRDEQLERFATLVAEAERDRMIAEGWRQCAEGQSTTQFCATAHQAYLDGVNSGIEAAAIRARGTP
jgi:hypothetical protein